MDNLNKRLKYEFKNSSLLELALTHRSASNTNNERLEFFGDAILNFFVSEMLFSKFPNLPEGGLTKLRSSIVRREVLNEIGESLNLSKLMRFGPSEITDNSSIFGNALEAIIGAIYLDSGYQKCSEVMYLLFREKIDSVDPNEDIYEGQVIGEHTRSSDLTVNVTKTKKLTNMRSSGSDDKVRIAPAIKFSLEEALEFIQSDEYVEVTPKEIRLRKILLKEVERKRMK